MRISSAAEGGIPDAIWAKKLPDEEVLYCFHCRLTWIQGKNPYARLIGHYEGGGIFNEMPERVVYVDSPKK